MKKYLFIIFGIFVGHLNAQTFKTYTDSTNRFSINIPIGWKYGKLKDYPTIKLFAYRSATDLSDTSKDNMNINIMENPGSNLEKSYSGLIESIKSAKNFKLLKEGDTILSGKKFKWLIESHENMTNHIQMHNYDFISYQNDKTYILTTVTFSNMFDKRRELLKSIANSFKIW